MRLQGLWVSSCEARALDLAREHDAGAHWPQPPGGRDRWGQQAERRVRCGYRRDELDLHDDTPNDSLPGVRAGRAEGVRVRRPVVNTKPPADSYHGRGERIVEYNGGGIGGLISLAYDEDAKRLTLTPYRTDPGVRIQVSNPGGTDGS